MKGPICKALLENKSLSGLLIYILSNTKNNEGKREMLEDYGLHARPAKFKLDKNIFRPDLPYSGGLMIDGSYYSFYRNETPDCVWNWIVNWYKEVIAQFGNDGRLPKGLAQLICSLVKIEGRENEFNINDELEPLVWRFQKTLNNN